MCGKICVELGKLSLWFAKDAQVIVGQSFKPPNWNSFLIFCRTGP